MSSNPFLDALTAQEDEARGAAVVARVLDGSDIDEKDPDDFADGEREPSFPDVDPDTGRTIEHGSNDPDARFRNPVPPEFREPEPPRDGRYGYVDADPDSGDDGDSDADAEVSAPSTPAYDDFDEPPPVSPRSGPSRFGGAAGGYDPDLDEDHRGYSPFDNDDDDDYRDRGPGLLSKVKDTLFGPGSWLSQHPGMKKPLIIAAVVFLVGGGVAMCTGDSPVSEPANPSMPQVQDTPAPDPESPAASEPRTIIPKEVNASCGPGGTKPSAAFSTEPTQAWVCVRSLGVDGTVLNIVFHNLVKVQSIYVVPGWNHKEPNGRNHWYEHRVVTKILWSFDGSKPVVQDIVPTPNGSEITFENGGIATARITMRVLQTVNPADGPGTGVDGDDGSAGTPPQTDPEQVDTTFAIGQIVITGTDA